MKNIMRAAALTAALVTGATGCGSSEKMPQISSTSAPTTNETTPKTDANGVSPAALKGAGFMFRQGPNIWTRTVNGDPRLAEIQNNIGTAAISFLAVHEPISVTVDNQVSSVKFSLPKPEAVRAIMFVPHDNDINKILPDAESTSSTHQSLNQKLEIQATVSVISQEKETFVKNAGIEYCQGIDMVDVTAGPSVTTTTPAKYTMQKEAACNTVGNLMDVAYALGNAPDGYQTYVREVQGKVLQGPAAHGAVINYPVLGEPDYARAVAIIKG